MLLLAAIDDCIPRVNAKKKPDTPWISKELIELCSGKKAAFRKAKRTEKSRDWKYYKKLNSTVKSRCKSARWEYITALTAKLKWNDTKPFWKYINSIRKGTNNLVLPLKVGNEEINDDLRIAETHIVFVGVYGRSV